MTNETDIIASIATSPIEWVVILVIIHVKIVRDDVLVFVDKSLNCHKIRNCLRPSIEYCYKVRSVLLIFVVFFVLSYYVSLRFEFRVVVFGTISVWTQCSVRPYLQLFVGAPSLISVICVCLWLWCPTHIFIVYLFCFYSSCVPYFASFSGLSIFDCPFGIL